MKYYTIYFPKNGKPYLKECEKYVNLAKRGFICNGKFEIYHPDYRLCTIVFCNLSEYLNSEFKNFEAAICINSETNRDKYEGFDYESATLICNQIINKYY